MDNREKYRTTQLIECIYNTMSKIPNWGKELNAIANSMCWMRQSERNGGRGYFD